MRKVLTIAGSDCSGGAGIQADLKTILANGCYGMSVITALTAQNTTGVQAIEKVTPEFLAQQIDSVFEDITPDAVKIGMISDEGLVRVIADRLRTHQAKNIVVDPVMVATSGADLADDESVKALVDELFAMASLVTPNIPEAEVLAGMKISTGEDMQKAAKIIGTKCGCAVLVKGGHDADNSNDVLYHDGNVEVFEAERIDNPNTHGTGCTLSSAIACSLAKGRSVSESVWTGKRYVYEAIRSGLDIGRGRGPLDHGFDIKTRYKD